MSAEELAKMEKMLAQLKAENAELKEAAKKALSARKARQPLGAVIFESTDYRLIPSGAKLIHRVGTKVAGDIEICEAVFFNSAKIVFKGEEFKSINAWAQKNIQLNLDKLKRKKANLNVFEPANKIFFIDAGGAETPLASIKTILRESTGGGGGGAPAAEEEAEGDEEEAEEEDEEAEPENYTDCDIEGKVFLSNDITQELFEKTPSGEPGAKVGKLTDTNKVEWVWNNKKIDGTFYRINAVGWVKATGAKGEWVGILNAKGELVKGAAPENF